MKARLERGKIVKYKKIPNTLKTISGTILNASKLSTERLEQLGFMDVITPLYDANTESIYNIHFDNELNAFTYDIKDRDYGVTIDQAKLAKLEELRNYTHSELSVTDWYITRRSELGTPIPQSVLDSRQAIRDSHNQRDNDIFELDNIAEVLEYVI